MVDPFEVAIAFMENAMQNGVELGLCQKVRKIEKRAEEDFVVYTQVRQYETRFIVNAPCACGRCCRDGRYPRISGGRPSRKPLRTG